MVRNWSCIRVHGGCERPAIGGWDQVPRDPTILSLYSAHRSDLVNYASSILGDRAHAEDVVQEAYLRFDQAAEMQALGEPLAYLYRIVRNLSFDVRRRLTRERTRETHDPEDAAGRVEAHLPSPEASAVSRQELRIIAAAMEELPERMRVALQMHRFDGRPLKEIAAHLGISVGLAHLLVVQGLEHCHQRLYRR